MYVRCVAVILALLFLEMFKLMVPTLWTCVLRPTFEADAHHMGGVKRVPCRRAFTVYLDRVICLW